jgi:curved DNA-binding protein CbpA
MWLLRRSGDWMMRRDDRIVWRLVRRFGESSETQGK